MQWEFIVALVLAIPILLFPVAFIWYVNIGGVIVAMRERKARRAVEEHPVLVTTR